MQVDAGNQGDGADQSNEYKSEHMVQGQLLGLIINVQEGGHNQPVEVMPEAVEVMAVTRRWPRRRCQGISLSNSRKREPIAMSASPARTSCMMDIKSAGRCWLSPSSKANAG